MGIALSALAGLFMPLQSFAHRWAAPRRSRRAAAPLRYIAIRPACAAHGAGTPAARLPAGAPRPLRVVRLADTHAAGRMVISGRMSDVCAELDRLAALENRSGRGGR